MVNNASLAYYPANRDALLKQHRLKLGARNDHFCGHDHFYNRARAKDASGNDRLDAEMAEFEERITV